MSELDKLKVGLDYCSDDEEIVQIKNNAIRQCRIYNSIDATDDEALTKHLEQMLGSIGKSIRIEQNFSCDNGQNIHVGDNFFANYNVTILDVTDVNIGDHVMIGPNSIITTVGHPISPRGRREHICVTSSVTIGSDVWIGANVTILQGVNIGSNVVIGAGAVVTKDIPDNSLAVGVPARVIQKIKNDLIK